MTENKKATVWQALIPLGFLVVLLVFNVLFFESDASYGPNQVALILAAFVGVGIAMLNGFSWDKMQKGMVDSVTHAVPSIIILLLIGSLAGTWLVSGIVPAMIYYGLEILSPKVFLVAACMVCMIVSLATGSSWSTAATVGIALLGIGKALGLSEGMIAGAVISGAYFGDKMSPLSDTTNLAPSMAGTDLFTHIRYMLWTTVPSISLALILFLILGFTGNQTADSSKIELVQASIAAHFNLNPLLFLVPIAVIIMIVKKMPALPALLIGVLLGGLAAVVFQPEILKLNHSLDMAEMSNWSAQYAGLLQALFGESQILTGDPMVESLLHSGGMMGMMSVILLVLAAMVFGGVMEKAGFLHVLVQLIIKRVERTGSLVAATAGTCVFFNMTASEQYVSIVVPGRMFADSYRQKKLPPQLLSRTLEDAGTVTSVLIPWNSCGAYHKGVLGVDPLLYLPYCFLNLISPFMTILVASIGFKIFPSAKK